MTNERILFEKVSLQFLHSELPHVDSLMGLVVITLIMVIVWIFISWFDTELTNIRCKISLIFHLHCCWTSWWDGWWRDVLLLLFLVLSSATVKAYRISFCFFNLRLNYLLSRIVFSGHDSFLVLIHLNQVIIKAFILYFWLILLILFRLKFFNWWHLHLSNHPFMLNVG